MKAICVLIVAIGTMATAGANPITNKFSGESRVTLGATAYLDAAFSVMVAAQIADLMTDNSGFHWIDRSASGIVAERPSVNANRPVVFRQEGPHGVYLNLSSPGPPLIGDFDPSSANVNMATQFALDGFSLVYRYPVAVAKDNGKLTFTQLFSVTIVALGLWLPRLKP